MPNFGGKLPMRQYLTALLADNSTRDALNHLGYSSNSFGSLRSLCHEYGVEIPQRTNQHARIASEVPVVAPKPRKAQKAYTAASAKKSPVELIVLLPDIHGHLVDCLLYTSPSPRD